MLALVGRIEDKPALNAMLSVLCHASRRALSTFLGLFRYYRMTNFRALLCASPGVMPAQHTQPTFCLLSPRLPDLSLPLAFVSPLRRRQTVLRMVMHTWRTDTVLHAHLGNLVGRR